jgi:tetratricopeptide (TPR) repeat protein
MLLRNAAVLLAAAAFAGGCADALTFSKTERAQGRIALDEGDYETAAGIFSRHVNNDPNDYKGHTHLAQARLAAGNVEGAVQSFRTALEVRKASRRGNADEPYRQLIIDEYARALAMLDDGGRSINDLQDRAGGDVDLTLVAAKANAAAGLPDAAITDFQTARKLDKKDQFVAKSYGLYLESMRQDIAAEEVLTQAYRLDTTDAEVIAGLNRLGIRPGPAILSRNELAKPTVPLGPLPQVRVKDPDGKPQPRTWDDSDLN